MQRGIISWEITGLGVDAPLPLRLCLCFGTSGSPMTDEAEMRRPPSGDAARSRVTVAQAFEGFESPLPFVPPPVSGY